MALPSTIQAILTRFRGTNNNAFNATSNPLGMGQGGHRQNFGPRLKDTADVVDWMSGAVDAVDADTQATAADRVQTGQDRTAAGQARDKAQAWANAPEDQEVESGKFSAFHFMRKAMAQFNLAKEQADAAAATYDAFDDRYLGAKSADPTADNDGNALIVGALYFSTSANVMKVWSGSAWQVQVPAAADYLARAGGTMTGLITFLTSQFATQTEAEAGANSTKLMTPLRVAQAISKLVPPAKFEGALLHVRDEKASGSASGLAPTTAVWNIRSINTVMTNQIGAVLSGDLITLAAGTYHIEANAPAIQSNASRLRLYDVGGAVPLITGGNTYSATSATVQVTTQLSGRFTLSAQRQVRLEQYFESGGSAFKAGQAQSITGVSEVYSDVRIWKVG